MRRLSLLGALGLLLLSVSTTFAVAGNSVWHAKLKVGSVTGGATMTEVAGGGRATLAVKLYAVKPSTTVTLSLRDGVCPGTATIAGRLTFKAPAAGPAIHRFTLTKAELAMLKADLTKKDKLSVSATANAKTGCGALALAP
jgi:hypothetical protein